MYPFDEINSIKDRLIGLRRTVAVAESVTSGHVQAALSLAENARQVYQGGMTAYNLGQKTRHLLVEPIHALDCDCVSEDVARQMALEVSRLFSSTYGLSVTGYAAEVPERNILRPFAFFSICQDGQTVLTRRVEAPETGVMEDRLSAVRSVEALPGIPAETITALCVQLWFTEQVLQAFMRLLT
jgi:nicotinamide-nucleotide amidase